MKDAWKNCRLTKTQPSTEIDRLVNEVIIERSCPWQLWKSGRDFQLKPNIFLSAESNVYFQLVNNNL